MRLAALLALASLTTVVIAAPASVAFDSFAYSGRDEVFAAPLTPGEFRNPILAGFYPDPSICRAGDDYYLVNSTFAYFPGLPIFHSRDLVNWTLIGHAVDRPTQLNFDGHGASRGLFAPALSYHQGTFYLVCTLIDKGGNFLLTAKNPAGPWSDPVWLKFDGIDPSLFFDDDGRAWMLNNGNPPDNRPLYQGHRAIWQQEFDIATQKLIGPRSIVVNGGVDLAKKPVWIEGPHLYKRDGWYYLCCAEGGTSIQHSQVILRSRSVTGPFVPWEKNPILTQRDLDGTVPRAVTCTGHADLVVGPDGQWWSVFLACRPFAGSYTLTGRETFLLPVKWTDNGWPLILPPGERVPYTVKSPSAANFAPSVATPLTGNFTWCDDFSSATLSPLWIMLRQPHETWWQVGQPVGKLRLQPRPNTLSGKANPAFLARRVQHAKFDTSVGLEVPAGPDISAGLALFQSETHHYFLAVRRTATGAELLLELADGAMPKVIARADLGDASHVQLRVSADETVLSFSYATKPDAWQPLAPAAETRPVTVQAAGGGLHFTGAVIGMHVRLDP
ncbi:MAG: glycoside hydrolase family 43 protein [Verrucomicrobia bacterium]|nr:glycoside hydrolase family 43 protein [Verrucomicrobiota bacterium]